VTAARPFAVKMSEILGNLSARVGDDFTSPLLTARGDEKYLIVLVSADKGLAGAFNANIIKATQAFANETGRGKQLQMIPVGRKGRDFFKRREMSFTEEYVGLTGTGNVNYVDAVEIAQRIIKTLRKTKRLIGFF
jgi:F-type H+-transporting ATPase subunit gamma